VWTNPICVEGTVAPFLPLSLSLLHDLPPMVILERVRVYRRLDIIRHILIE
jgi:hypothetical protein